MIRRTDLLSLYPDAVKVKSTRGFVVPSDSEVGISWDIADQIYYPSRSYHQQESTKRPRVKLYLEYIVTEYKSKMKFNRDGYAEFNRNEYFLPTGEPVFIGDCGAVDSGCRRNITKEVIKIHRLYFSRGHHEASHNHEELLREKKSDKPKVKKCRCKK